jgi:hypothetical protein
MGEIKFSELVWDYDRDKFIKWHYWGLLREGEFIGPCNSQNTQCKFTDLYDKNGKETYEGDIVRVIGEIWEVVYRAPEFCIERPEKRNGRMDVRAWRERTEEDAQEIVDSIVERPVPLVRQSGQMKRVLDPNLSLRDQVLVLAGSSAVPVATASLQAWTE